MTESRELPPTESRGDATMARRERVAWALLFSIPPGIGVAIATAKVSLGEITDPLVVTAFTVTSVVLFAIVYTAATVNQDETPTNRSAEASSTEPTDAASETASTGSGDTPNEMRSQGELTENDDG